APTAKRKLFAAFPTLIRFAHIYIEKKRMRKRHNRFTKNRYTKNKLRDAVYASLNLLIK
ncbi:hypothetical protein HMPREF0774_2481, partial [Staphylococcus aureus subsp. aureus TCH130]